VHPNHASSCGAPKRNVKKIFWDISSALGSVISYTDSRGKDIWKKSINKFYRNYEWGSCAFMHKYGFKNIKKKEEQ
jgi:hypothetical protein